MKDWIWQIIGLVIGLIVIGICTSIGYMHGYCDGKGGVLVNSKCLDVKELK